jgi:hypothetical protein
LKEIQHRFNDELIRYIYMPGIDHDAVMRIGGEAPGGGPILSVGIGAMSAAGSRHLGLSIGSPR